MRPEGNVATGGAPSELSTGRPPACKNGLTHVYWRDPRETRMYTDRPVDLSFVVVNYKAEEQTAQCIRSLARFADGVSSEFLVVDNTPGAKSHFPVAGAPQALRIVPGRNIGYGSACNEGLKESTGRYVFFFNPDVKYESGSAVKLVRWLDEHPRVGAAGPRIVNPNGTRQFSCRGFPSWKTALCGSSSLLTRFFPANRWTQEYLRTDLNEELREIDWISGCCFVGRRKALEQIEGFDRNFFLFFEDVDLCRRLDQAQWTRVYYPAIRFEHEIGSSRLHLWDRGRRQHYVSAARYFTKHAVGYRWSVRCLYAVAVAAIVAIVRSALR